MIAVLILCFLLALPIAALSWWLMRWSKDPHRRAKYKHGWGLWAPEMQPHWDRLLTWHSPEAALIFSLWRDLRQKLTLPGTVIDFLWIGLRVAAVWIHAKIEALKNIGTEWCRLDAMRAFKVMSNVAFVFGLAGYAIGRFP